MARYAVSTEVPADRSRSEIERTLQRYGASHFAYGWGPDGATVGFTAAGRHVRFQLPMPDRDDPAFTRTETGRDRSPTAAQAAWEQACRSSWRALALVVKAKLEAVSAGITTFEAEFLAHIILPNGLTVGEWAAPQLEAVYADGGRSMPALLPGGDR